MPARTFRMIVLVIAIAGAAAGVFAQTAPPEPAPAPTDPKALLAQFWEAYTAGDGLAYVVIKDGRGERVYRYGNVSRLAAKKDPRGFMMFTCASPHVFIVEEITDQADLLNAKVVKSGEPRFAELDGKYVSGCRNPFVKSAIPKEAK
jgi:hypothetical protein